MYGSTDEIQDLRKELKHANAALELTRERAVLAEKTIKVLVILGHVSQENVDIAQKLLSYRET